MKRLKNRGFVLLFVIVAIALVGVIMIVLTTGSDTMMFQSDMAYLRAIERNLTASGLAWARLNVLDKSPETFNRTLSLDLANVGIRGSSLTIAIGAATDKQVEVRINTSCARGRRTRDHAEKYMVQLQ